MTSSSGERGRAREHPVYIRTCMRRMRGCVCTSLESPARFIDIARIGLPRYEHRIDLIPSAVSLRVNPDCEPRGDAGTRERNINREDRMLLRSSAGRDLDHYDHLVASRGTSMKIEGMHKCVFCFPKRARYECPIDQVRLSIDQQYRTR